MSRDVVVVESERVRSRLETMPLSRVDAKVVADVRAAALRIVELTPDPDRPKDAELPVAGVTALAAQLAVVVRDYLDMPTAASDDAAVAQVLSDLRRSLP